jgi:hypothetical protein
MGNLKLPKSEFQRGEYALIVLVVGLLGGWLVIAAFAFATTDRLGVLGVASMVAAASTLAGMFLGFLFGVPRTLQQGDGVEDSGATKDKSNGSPYRPNTNLEQISDWLTKILLGAGLTQIGSIRLWIRNLGVSLEPGFGGQSNAYAFAIATVIYYMFDGFLIGYLWTRLYLAGAMHEADVETLTRRIDEIKQQRELDAKALALVIQQLNPSGGANVPGLKDLTDSIRDASAAVKSQIFYQAQNLRQESWYEPSKKAKMERTIPIFRALIAIDTDEEYHKNYGQLGFALKDQRTPDWKAAEEALTKAIQIRGVGQGHRWAFYEFNRALCWIQTDQNFKVGQKSSADVAKKIVADLKVGKGDDDVWAIIQHEGTLQAWLMLNGIQL